MEGRGGGDKGSFACVACRYFVKWRGVWLSCLVRKKGKGNRKGWCMVLAREQRGWKALNRNRFGRPCFVLGMMPLRTEVECLWSSEREPWVMAVSTWNAEVVAIPSTFSGHFHLRVVLKKRSELLIILHHLSSHDIYELPAASPGPQHYAFLGILLLSQICRYVSPANSSSLCTPSTNKS